MINNLSILIPCYNCNCATLVKILYGQCQLIEDLHYEIAIVDDGSTDELIINQNKALVTFENVKYYSCSKSKNRSFMRNRLSTFAIYEWQLQINGNVDVIRNDFILKFLKSAEDVTVVCGNTSSTFDPSNLRSLYEYSFYKKNDIEYNNRHPYCYFRNTCCMYHQSVFDRVRYDEDINGYGYEDVVFGQELRKHNISIAYIDNPVSYNLSIDNESYLKKTEEALFTLYCLKDKPQTPLLQIVEKLQNFHATGMMRLYHNVFRSIERYSLCGSHPSMTIFSLYKLGYYLSL